MRQCGSRFAYERWSHDAGIKQICGRIGDVQKGYERIRLENKDTDPSLPRRTLKRKLHDTFDDLEFHQPKRVNEPELISSKKLRDMAIDDYDDEFEPEMKIECIYSAAKILRKAILDDGNSMAHFLILTILMCH